MAGFPEILRLANKIGLPEILEKHTQLKYNKEIKTSDLMMSHIGVRICNPRSILGTIPEIQNSTIPTVLGIDAEKLNEDLFYKRYKSIGPKSIEAIQQEVFDSVKEVYDIDLSDIDWDPSFIYVEGKKNELASKGRNATNKSKPNGVKVALLQSRGRIPTPLFYRLSTGKTADVTMLREDKERIKKNFKDRDSLLSLDRFTKSDKDIADFKRDGVDVLSGDRITEKVAEEIKELEYQEIEIEETKMKHAMSTRVVKVEDEEITIWRHVFFDPSKAERDRKRREKKNKKLKNQQMKTKKEIEKGKFNSKMLKRLNKMLKRKGIKADINLDIEDIEYEEIQDNPSMDGVMSISVTKEMKPEDVFTTYRKHLLVEKAFRELKQFHLFRPLFVRNERMVDVLMLMSFLSYLLMCLFRMEHKPFEKSNDGTIGAILNKPCTLVKTGMKLHILLSKRVAEIFGKFVEVNTRIIGLDKILSSILSYCG